MEYVLEIRTVAGIADSAYLDRLAEIVYDVPGLIDPLLALGEDGSISASVGALGSDPVEAARSAVSAFVDACVAAGPLVSGHSAASETVERLTVARAVDRALA